MKSAGVWEKAGTGAGATDAIISRIVVIIITIVCVFGILYISKWGRVEES